MTKSSRSSWRGSWTTLLHLHPASLPDTDLGWWDIRGAKPGHILILLQKGCIISHQTDFMQWSLVALLTKRASPRKWVVFAQLASQIHCSHCHQHRALPLDTWAVVHFHFTGVHSAAELWDWVCFQELCPTDKFNSSLHFKWHMVQSLLLLSTLTLKEHLFLILSLLYLLLQNLLRTEERLKD